MAAARPATLNGSGSTFQKPFQEAAIEAFTKANASIKINYGGGGSGKGRQDFADMVVDFAGSDAPYKDADLAKVKGGDVPLLPDRARRDHASATTSTASTSCSSRADTIAKIFQREIKKWNDPAIAADNPGAKLPGHGHRGRPPRRRLGHDRELHEVPRRLAAPDAWKLKSGSTVEWPADTQAGKGNGGVAQIVKSTKGAIGYVDLSDAKASGLHYASVKNKAGKYVEPTRRRRPRPPATASRSRTT